MSCLHPIILGRKLVPCGKCINCRKKKVSEWALRLELEARKYNRSDICFCTLTYNDEHLPADGLLCKRDVQLFIKRLRKRVYPIKLRYFLAGEYGGQFGRPHYHVIFFGIGIKFQGLIDDCWHNGFTQVKSVNSSHFSYVAKYSVKQFSDDKVSLKTGEVMTEFTTMSRRVPIGICTIENYENALKILIDGKIQIKDYSYSIPKSFKQYMFRKWGLKKVPTHICFYYNENIYDKFEFVSILDKLFAFDKELLEISKIPDFNMKMVDIKSFRDFRYDIDLSKKKAKEYLFRKHIPISKFDLQFIKAVENVDDLYKFYNYFFRIF